jgi:hypothetical protein
MAYVPPPNLNRISPPGGNVRPRSPASAPVRPFSFDKRTNERLGREHQARALTPARQTIFNTALTSLREPQALHVLANGFDRAGLPDHADMLRRRAMLPQSPGSPDLFRQALQSQDVNFVLNVANQFNRQGATNAAQQLYAYAHQLQGLAPMGPRFRPAPPAPPVLNGQGGDPSYDPSAQGAPMQAGPPNGQASGSPGVPAQGPSAIPPAGVIGSVMSLGSAASNAVSSLVGSGSSSAPGGPGETAATIDSGDSSDSSSDDSSS